MEAVLSVRVLVGGEASHEDDKDVPGTYGVSVTLQAGVDASGLSAEQLAEIASAVKDEFHDKIGIEVLDDFQITLMLEDGTVIDDDGFESETGLVVVADFEGVVEASDEDDDAPDVDALVNALDEKTAKAVLAGILGELVRLGFHRDDPINGGDCVDAMSSAYETAMAAMGAPGA